MKQEVQVLYVSRYDFTDDATGQVIRGCKITYSSKDCLKDKDFVGYKVNTSNFPYDTYDKFLNLKFPIKCEITLEINDVNKKPRVTNIVVL